MNTATQKKEDSKFIQAYKGTKLNKCSSELIKAELNKILVITGASERSKPTAKNAELIVEQIKTVFGQYTINELAFAFQLAVQGKIEVELKYFDSVFSVNYIRPVLNAYNLVRWSYIQELERQQTELTKEKKDQMNLEALQRMYDKQLKYYAENLELDPKEPEGTFERLFNWLRKDNKIVVDESEREEIIQEATIKWKQFLIGKKKEAENKNDYTTMKHFKLAIDDFDNRVNGDGGKAVISRYAKMIKLERYFNEIR